MHCWLMIGGWLDNLFQILADEDRLHGKADFKSDAIHLSSNHICLYYILKGSFFDLRMTLVQLKTSSVLKYSILS